jgi:hypothetical protein
VCICLKPHATEKNQGTSQKRLGFSVTIMVPTAKLFRQENIFSIFYNFLHGDTGSFDQI